MAHETENDAGFGDGVERTYTVFLINSKSFAVDVGSIKEIVKLKDLIPLEEPFEDVQGFIELHSVRIPVLNTRKILKLESDTVDAGVMIVNIEGRILGFIVDIDAGLEVFTSIFKPKALKGSEPFKRFVEGTLDLSGKIIYVLPLGSLLSKKCRARLFATG